MASIMFQGTASNVGKSVLCTGICRVLYEDGYSVIPFKSQNMSLDTYFDKNGKAMGIGQALQAEACGLEPMAYMNPILLKPCGNHVSEVLLLGDLVSKMSSEEYREYKYSLVFELERIYEEVKKDFDIVVLEGAGSPAEININSLDLSNMEMAKISESPVILIADIDRGGVFASIVGTLQLLNQEDRERVKGVIINKFRGNKDYFSDGIKMLEEIISIPVVGVVPFIDINLEEEDGACGIKNNVVAKSSIEKEKEFEKLSRHLRENLDFKKIYEIIFEDEKLTK